MEKHIVSICLDQESFDILAAMAKETERSRSACVRFLLRREAEEQAEADEVIE